MLSKHRVQHPPLYKPGFCDRVSAWFGHSLSIFWGTLLVFVGAALDLMPLVMDFVNAPEITTVINDYAGPYASHALKAIGVITVLVRLRTLRKGYS